MATPRPALACNDATQAQLYPLGVANGSMIALEVIKIRGGAERSTIDVTARLVRVSGRGKHRTVARIGRFKARTYSRSADRALRRLHKKAVVRAKRLRGFKAIRMTRWTTCEHRKKCGRGKVTAKSQKLSVTVGRTRQVVKRHSKRAGAYEVASVRHFLGAKTKWVIVDLRAGDHRCYSVVNASARRQCLRKKQHQNKPEGHKHTLRADSSALHHGDDVAVVLRVR